MSWADALLVVAAACASTGVFGALLGILDMLIFGVVVIAPTMLAPVMVAIDGIARLRRRRRKAT